SASASVAPNGPAPTIAMSGRAPGTRTAGCLDVGNALRRRAGQILDAVGGHENVVLDPHANVPEALGDVVGGTNVGSRLDGQHHSGSEAHRLASFAIRSGVVHVHAEPMPGTVHVETLVGALLEDCVERTPDEPVGDEA